MDAAPLLTADEYARHPLGQEPGELVRGVLHVMTPAGGPHGVVIANLLAELIVHARRQALGRVFADNVGFHLDIPGETTDTVRSPDVAFVRADRLPGGEVPIGFLRCAPDLAVEVLSPDDRPGELTARMRDYFAAGSARVWVVDPDARTVTAHAPEGAAPAVPADGVVDGAPVLPGFTMPVGPLFDGLQQRA
jgi:Uma2 family endonuclease